MNKEEVKIFYPASLTDWQSWLEKNHRIEQAVWLVFYNKASGKPSITWSEAVDVALCYGWIDSKKIKACSESSHQFFSRRKPLSTWSKINKAKVEVLIARDLMTESGYQSIEIAKQNGSWTFLDDVEELLVPQDLAGKLNSNPNASAFFLALSKSVKKAILQWLVLAKRPETRQKRIDEIVDLALKNQKPKHLQ
jgi:uncharacterized protein YdeI (YjbR/CyaY-like superfamily)